MMISFDASRPRAFWNAVERAVEEGRVGEARTAVDAFDEASGWVAAEQAGVTGGYTLARTAALDALDAALSAPRHPGVADKMW